ncbi:MAG TPA: hypothetical protein DIU39_08865 [Flavobacteriales bacterium]|nr:hypothetical protein [Flavobacteriales bacterium]
MKKSLLTLLAAIPVAIIAQPTLDASINPVIGDSYTVYQVDSNALEGAQGANVIWDFTNWVGYGFSHNIDFMDPANTPYASGYPNSTVALKDSSSYQFLIPYSTDIQSEGMTIDMTSVQPLIGVVNISLTDYMQLMSYPFTYNSTFNDAYSGNINSGAGTGTYSGNIVVTGDGYGTLMLPNGNTFTNVLRVYTYDQGTTNIPLLGTITYQRHIYDFYDTTVSKHPIVSVVHTDLNGTLMSWVYSSYPIPVGVKEIDELKNINLYPVPASNQTTLSFDLKTNSIVNIRLIDNLGREIEQIENTKLSAGTHQYKVDVSSLSSGIYFIQMVVEGKVLNKKLIIE